MQDRVLISADKRRKGILSTAGGIFYEEVFCGVIETPVHGRKENGGGFKGP